MTTFSVETFRDEIEKEIKRLIKQEKKNIVAILNVSADEFIDTAVLLTSKAIGIPERDINKSISNTASANTYSIKTEATEDRKFVEFIVRTLKVGAKKLNPLWSKAGGLTLSFPKITAGQSLLSISRSNISYPHAFPVEKFKAKGLYYQRKGKERFPIKKVAVDYDPTQLKVFFSYEIFGDIFIRKLKNLR